jgi:hypothetical protein
MNITVAQLKELLGGQPDSDPAIEYAVTGNTEIQGWIEPGILPIVFALDAIHKKLSITGGAMEIGVHHGRFFIALANVCDSTAEFVAIDVFEDQHKNIDGSGKGNEQEFRASIEKYCDKPVESISIIKADSLGLRAGAHSALNPGMFRLISIDGGHTAAHTFNDLVLAEQLVADGGVVFVDDILHPDWMGVMEGLIKYRLFSAGVLVPFLVTANKMVLAKATHHGTYMEFFAKKFPLARKKSYKWMGEYLTVGYAPTLIPDE